MLDSTTVTDDDYQTTDAVSPAQSQGQCYPNGKPCQFARGRYAPLILS